MISVIIPLYNKKEVILSTLASVKGQSFPDWECIIVDDGSNDNSAQIVKEFIIDDARFLYYLKPNGGPSSARNYGVERVNGEWVVFLDADDTFAPNAFNSFKNAIDNNPGYNCYAFDFWISNNGELRRYSKIKKSSMIKNPFKEWYLKRFMPRTGAAIFNKKILMKIKHNEQLRRFEDAEILFNIFREEQFYFSNIPVMTYCYDNKSASCVRKNFKEDFFAHIDPKHKSFWEKMVLYKYYNASFLLYKEQAKKVYKKNPFNMTFVIVSHVVSLYYRIIAKFIKI